MGKQPGLVLLVLLLLVLIGYDYGRHLFVREGVPAFYVEQRAEIQVLLEGQGWPQPGVHQINDDLTPIGVIYLADLPVADSLLSESSRCQSLENGERLVFQIVNGRVVGFQRGWMPAAQRITLGIPLHPDRMSRRDWEDLPGIGPKLAAEIETDRQENGGFGTLERLKRVRGIGKKRLQSWKEFF